ncbi:MAG: Lrp/AsnC family transcriptional regulator [Fibrobacter sp.]|nr:Lrp/AsnC family transcriptional regulator [Fibrobacter sp.]
MTSPLEQNLLNIIQDEFPLETRPYQVLAEQLQQANPVDFCAIGETEVFQAVERLRESGVVRRIGAVYDSRKLGFTSRLCCGKVSETALDAFAAAVLDEPSITHNYVRNHAFNVWFTVIGKSAEDIAAVAQKLQQRTALTDVHILDSKRMFKINTVMGKIAAREQKLDFTMSEAIPASLLSQPALRKCRALFAGDFPHSLTPFATIASQISSETSVEVSESQVIAQIRCDLNSKIARRFGAVLRHQKAGFAENAMVVFKVDENAVEQAGQLLSAETQVSHCYERTSFDGFPYNLYAMIHETDAEQLHSTIMKIVDKLNNPAYCVLRSVKELKKTSFNYFV